MSLIKRFSSSERGTVAIISALLSMTTIVSIVGVMDFGGAFYNRARLQSALDAAVLSSASEGRKMILDGVSSDIPAWVEQHGEKFFRAKVAPTGAFEGLNVVFEATVDGTSLEITATANGTYEYKFLPLVGVEEAAIIANANASLSLTAYIAIDFLVDASGSMGIGATDEDQDRIFDATGCAFSCHTNNSGRYDQAIASGGIMRIDVARNSIINSIDVMRDESAAGEVRAGLHLFSGGGIDTRISSVDDGADDLDNFENVVRNETHLHEQWTGSNIGNSLRELAAALPDSGGGLTEDTPRRFVIVVSDFIENAQQWRTGMNWFADPDMIWSTPQQTFAGHEIMQALDASTCDDLKDKEISVFFVNTTYLIPWGHPVSAHNEWRFNFIEDSIFPVLPARLEACTGSASKVIEATSVDEIENAIEQAVLSSVAPLHLYDD